MMTKRSANVLILCGCLALVPLRAIAAQWTQTSGPEGCEVLQVVGGAGKVFCLVEDYGIYFSADRGAHWSPISLESRANPTVSCLMWKDGTLFAGSDGFVAFSTDAGGQWHYIQIGALNQMPQVITLALIGADLLVGTWDGLYACPDYARKFSAFRLDLPKKPDFRSIAVLGQEVYTCGLRGPFFRLQKTGQDWVGTELQGLRPHYEVMGLLALGPDLFAATDEGIVKSADRGESWIRITPRSSEDLYISCLGVDGHDVLAGVPPILHPETPPGIRLSKGSGQEWTLRSLGLKRTDINGFVSDGQYLYAGTSRGIWVTRDHGVTWLLANAGLPVASEVRSLAVIGPNIFASTSQGPSVPAGLSASTDDAATWQIVEPDLAADFEIHGLAVIGADLFLNYSYYARSGSADVERTRVLRSPDYGRNWLHAGSGLPRDAWISRLEVSGSSIFAYGLGVFESRDKGVHWTRRGKGLPVHFVSRLLTVGEDLYAGLLFDAFDGSPKNPLSSILSILAGGQRLFAMGPPPTSRLYVLRKEDSKWTDTRIRFSSAIEDLAKIGTTLFAGTYRGLYIFEEDFRWAQALKLEPSLHLSVTSLAVYGPDVFVGCYTGVYLLRKAGDNWKLIDTGLRGENHVTCLAMTDTFLYAGTRANGVWRAPLSELRKIGP